VATSGLEETEDADADPEAGMLTTGDICLRKVSTVLSPLAQTGGAVHTRVHT